MKKLLWCDSVTIVFYVQSADGVGSRQGSSGQRVPACRQPGRQEVEGVCRGKKPKRRDHVGLNLDDVSEPWKGSEALNVFLL